MDVVNADRSNAWHLLGDGDALLDILPGLKAREDVNWRVPGQYRLLDGRAAILVMTHEREYGADTYTVEFSDGTQRLVTELGDRLTKDDYDRYVASERTTAQEVAEAARIAAEQAAERRVQAKVVQAGAQRGLTPGSSVFCTWHGRRVPGTILAVQPQMVPPVYRVRLASGESLDAVATELECVLEQ